MSHSVEIQIMENPSLSSDSAASEVDAPMLSPISKKSYSQRKLEFQAALHEMTVNKMDNLRTVNNKSTRQLTDQLTCVQRVVNNLPQDDLALEGEKKRKKLTSSRSVQSMRSYFKP
ncbi:predicted protein [Naegleria gruberi]|uniref:Predicted protein n=1 Tax=Naegleria gruberi TaxID=5762 RepID=D2VH93_NAEGR|nr:uncharacterized protein NAEGRDRAFT_68133 [Naegleria gruberi]EFC43849.1 predicted protein [Naegleria gruberi]|eukprot:XP_002676593.1 predicted protein [Naegleria gruberi strain NEG-M]